MTEKTTCFDPVVYVYFFNVKASTYYASGGQNPFLNAKASTYYASGGQNPFLNVKASTYYASGGQNPFFSDFYDAKPKFRIFYIAATALGPI